MKTRDMSYSTPHIKYLLDTDNRLKALRIFEEQHRKYKKETPLDKMEFAIAAARMFKCFLNNSEETLSLRLADDFKIQDLGDGRYSVKKLYDFFMDELKDPVQKFDNRNGNSYYSDEIAEFA